MPTLFEKKIERLDKYCVISYHNITCKLTFPNSEYQYYYVSPHNDTDYKWYDKINLFCIKHMPTEQKILDKIYKNIDKQNEIGIKHNTQSIRDLSNGERSIDNIDVSYYRLKEKLEKYAKTSNFLENDFTQTKSIKQLYNEKNISNILIEEYLKCHELTKSNFISLELLNENIFSWKICFNSFNGSDELSNDLNKLYKQSGYKCIEVEVLFHGKLYPNYPPIIRIVKPNLCDSISHRISNSKMIQLSYWTPSRSIKYVINRLYGLLNKWARVDFSDGTIVSNYPQVILDLNSNLQKMSSFIDPVAKNDEIDDDEIFIKFNNDKNDKKTSPSKSNSYWKKGTGYGHSGLSKWDVDEFVKLQQEKNLNISNILNKILDNLQLKEISSYYNEMCETVTKSLLFPYLIQQFRGTTLLDIKNREILFKVYFKIIEVLSTEQTIKLFGISFENITLYTVLCDLHEILKAIQKICTEDQLSDDFENSMMYVLEKTIPMYNELKIHSNVENQTTSNEKTITDINELYYDKLKKHKFEYSDIYNTNFKSEYLNRIIESKGQKMVQCKKRLKGEISTFIQPGSLPINFESSIFLRIDENNPTIMRALITGPKDTPYDSGCLIFDIYTGNNYPNAAPNFWFMNHGKKRFNPNLYDCGKVCLSMLGTYVGPTPTQSEKWNSQTSNLLQVLISIQSQILIEEPYFNEPGHESYINQTHGISSSKKYNANIRLYTMTSTIYQLLENPSMYPQFTDVIIDHFKMKKDYILELCDKWTNEAPSDLTQQYENLNKKIKTLINDLN